MATPARCPGMRTEVAVVVHARWHDDAFARAQILARLAQHDSVVPSVHADFSDIDRLGEVDAVIAYTCDVRPSGAQAAALRDTVRRGGRLLALHATNSAIDAPEPGAPRIFRTPDAMPEFSALLGNRFLAHPRIAPFLIEPVQPQHPLVQGIGPFTTVDEIYVAELSDDLDVLLDVAFTGECPGFEADRAEGRHPVLFTRREGDGLVTNFTLGHCRGRFDVQDLGVDDLGVVDRVAWESPEYREVLRRCIDWAVHGDAWLDCPTTEEA